MKIKRIRGVNDILPGDIEKWQWVEQTAHRTFARYGFSEIRTPIFESTRLFARGIGEATDIVEKEMYTFQDKSGDSVTLRPEGTASVVRSFIENKMYGPGQLSKLYYIGPMFRYERPQAGRFRQFYTTVRSIADTLTVGTRIAWAEKRPSRCGRIRPMPLSISVFTGMIDCTALRVLRR